jgi:hypothetical protein
MKKLILAAAVTSCAVGVFAQGTVQFQNRIAGTLITHVYAPFPGNPNFSRTGNGATDVPVGATDWTGYATIGATGTGGQYGGATTLTALLGGPLATPESSLLPGLLPQGATTTFRTGTAGGNIAGGAAATFGNVAADAASAIFEMVAWDNSSGLYPTWASAQDAWKGGLIAAGTSPIFTLSQIGGTTNTPPPLLGLQSFNLYFIPEPTTAALLGLGAAGMLIFRRRK